MLRSALKCGRVEQRLMELGLAVPEAAAPAANYVPSVRSGNLLFISGQIPKQPDNSLLKGQLGASYSLEEGK
ncbi:Protein TCP17, partial [Durusdinium trenchii]